MRWFLIVLLIATLHVASAHSGTFLDDFHDRNLDGWHLSIHPPGIGLPVAFKDGYLVSDTRIEKNELPEGFFKLVSLELTTGYAEDWNAYTLTCRVRFAEVVEEASGFFTVGVRRSVRQFDVVAQQAMLIDPVDQHVQVDTIPPDARRDLEKRLKGKILREIFDREHLRRPIKLGRWLPIKIVADEQYFEFHFDENLITRYDDETAVPGTVWFQVGSEMVAHLDDVKITGPEIPNIGSPQSVNPEARLATTWGELKNSLRR